ncbi:MAG: hypothetical protein ACRD0U_03455 [Acidimicrobiales bacterium]
MDEIDLVASVRSDAAPTAETVARHHAQLRAAINATTRPGGDHGTFISGGDGPPPEPVALEPGLDQVSTTRRRRSGRVVAGAAAAGIVLIVGVALAAHRTRGLDDQQVTASSGETGDRTMSQPLGEGASACGSELPFSVPVPDGYAGPIDGTSGDSVTPSAADQLVRHWTDGSGTIEVRWPADASNDAFSDGGVVVSPTGEALDTPGYGETTATADAALTRVILSLPQAERTVLASIFPFRVGDGACQALQVTIAGRDAFHAREIASQLWARLFAPDGPLAGPVVPLVTSSTSAGAAPVAGRCEDPSVANKGGPVTDLGSYAAAADALRAFITTQTMTTTDPFGFEISQPTIADAGYTEITLPDGSIAYANQAQDFVGAVIHAAQVDGGWTVDHWDGSGC